MLSCARRSFLLGTFLSLAAATESCAKAGGSPSPDGGGGDDASTIPVADANAGDSSPSPSDGAAPDGGVVTPRTEGGAGPLPDGGAASPPDAAPESAAPDGACASGVPAIHDDFESGSLGAWQVTDPFGNPIPQGSTQYSVTIDRTHVRGSGMYSVKVHNGGLFGMAPPGAAFYGRVWAWLGSSPGDVPSGGHWAWIIGVGAPGTGQPAEVRMGGQFGILMDNFSTNDDVVMSDPNFFNDGMSGGAKVTAGGWTCVEFYFGKDSLRTWINGSEITSLDVTPTTTWDHGMKAPWSPAYSAVRIGYANYNAFPIDVWYDDVAIDTRRICCP